MTETIFAQATPPGRSGVAIIRISGPLAAPAAAALGACNLPARQAAVRRLADPRDGQPIDQALALRFEAPRSFTGEDVVELQVHGGPAVCRSVLDVLLCQPGLRVAEAGEFTRQAMRNGRLDLAQVEGLGDLLAAETRAQSQRALALMEGTVSRLAAGWRDRLVDALALVEASLDFSDEDLGDTVAGVADDLAMVAAEMRREILGSDAAERVRLGFEVAIIGRPNVGKSTLLNAIAGRDAAITSEFAGTTRDTIEITMDIRGLPVTLIDTAGLRDSTDPIEVIGVDRARRRAESADLRVFLVDSGEDLLDLGVMKREDDAVVFAKADLRSAGDGVSGLTGAGVDRLLDEVAEVLVGRASGGGAIGHQRQRAAVVAAEEAVLRAVALLSHRRGELDLVAEELRLSLHALDVLVGRVEVEDLLDAIFSRFCIGK